MAFGDEYYRYLASCDLAGAWHHLGTLEGEELREAKAWFQRRQTDVLVRAYADACAADSMQPRGHVPLVSVDWVLALGPVRLLAPKAAARSVPWRSLWGFQEVGAAFLVERLCEADREWAAAFVEEASGVRAGGQGWTLAAVLRPVAVHHRLPCPTGDTFLEHWSAGVPEMGSWRVYRQDHDPVGWLSSDPFMPDLLLRYLASGHCGSSAWLPEALPELVHRGVVDRDAVVQHALVQLTAPQRPASQKVLVGILTRLGLAADEVPGGCSYLLGVISTSTGLVGKQLLPLAIATVEGPDDLAELTAIVAGRPEKAQRMTLLSALRSGDLRDRVGVESVRDALNVLARGDDAAFVKSVRAALGELPGGVPADGEPGPVEGLGAPTELWDQPPTPSGRPYVGGWGNALPDPTWGGVVDVKVYTTEAERSRLVDQALSAMAAGTFDPAPALAQLRAVHSSARLSMSTTLTVLRDLFFCGGLRQGYRLALDLADAVVGSPTQQPGTADLIRLLVQHAADIPPADRPGLPPQLAAFAERPGATKAQEEARLLRDRLGDRASRTATAAGEARPHRGLWDRPGEPTLADHVLPGMDRRLSRQLFDPSVSWWALGEMTGGFAFRGTEGPDGHAPGDFFCGPDVLVSGVVSSVTRAGTDQVRDRLRTTEPAGYYGSWGGHLLALRTWADGQADPGRFWQFALSARTAGSLIEELGGYHDLDPSLREALMPHLTGWDAIALDGPAPNGTSYGLVLARSLDPWGERLQFLRALEALLLAERNSTVLAAPVWADGTLDLDHLLARLRAAVGKPFGPLDVVQALHRLRPCDPARATELDELRAAGGAWCTAPELTSPDGDESWDVVDVVRTWVAAGGLPPLDAVRGPDGRWRTDAVAPVPWSRCAAAPPELREGGWPPLDALGVARTFPLWPDLTLSADWPGGSTPGPSELPARLSGAFGLPLHEVLATLLEHGIAGRDAARLGVARLAIRCGKVATSTYASAVRAKHDCGRLDVDALARATEAMFEQECLAQLWEPTLAAAEMLCGLPGPPVKGLARMLDVLAAYVAEVPEPVVPAAVRSFAASTAKTKPYQAARALVRAVETHAGVAS